MLDGLFTRIEVPKYIINFLSCVHVGTIIEFIFQIGIQAAL